MGLEMRDRWRWGNKLILGSVLGKAVELRATGQRDRPYVRFFLGGRCTELSSSAQFLSFILFVE
jgi:hypothetical protein